jgi:hypothetical protein
VWWFAWVRRAELLRICCAELRPQWTTRAVGTMSVSLGVASIDALSDSGPFHRLLYVDVQEAQDPKPFVWTRRPTRSSTTSPDNFNE